MISEFDLGLRRSLLNIAAEIEANGGPHNPMERGYYDSAIAAGVSDIEIRAAASSIRPILKGLEHLIQIDNF